MAITHFLLQSNFHLSPTKWSSRANNNNSNIPLKRNYPPCYCIKTSPKFNIKCSIMNPKPEEDHNFMATSSPARMEATNVVEPSPYELALFVSILLVSSYFITKWFDDWLHSELTSVLKLQVGLLGTNTSVQRDLKRIVGTDKRMSYVLQEATLALLRYPDYCIFGYSSVDVKRRPGDGERRFNHLSVEERIKFDVVDADTIGEKSATSQSSNNEYIVVTILVAASKDLKLPPVMSSEQLKKALQILASIPSNYINNVEVFWYPQHENDSLTEQELLEDYPLLHLI